MHRPFLALMLCIATVVSVAAQQSPRDQRPAVARALQDPILVAEEVFQATVTAVEDGDTLAVKTANAESVVVQIASVDAPELSQPGGPEAKAFLTKLVLGKIVTVRLQSTVDRSARVEIAGTDISAALIRNGMAWHCPRYADDRELTIAESDARTSKRGLWSTPRPTPPWLYRRAGACWQEKSEGRRKKEEGGRRKEEGRKKERKKQGRKKEGSDTDGCDHSINRSGFHRASSRAHG